MILMSDEVRAWGHIVTMHYTHPPRSVVTQASLAGRADFTQTDPVNPIFRAIAFFTGLVADGGAIDLTAAPRFGAVQFRATGLTEFRGQLIADNCGARAVVSQFGWPGTSADAAFEAAGEHVVIFHNPGNGTIAFKHIVRMFSGGRIVAEAEAVAKARADAERFGIDLEAVTMTVSSGVEALLAQSVDLASGVFRTALP